MSTYKTTIGIEVHAELKTESKMFCGCKNDPHASEPNENVCPICMAHPGTLPTVNKCAVEKMLQVGSAVGGEIATFSEFDRKNYFYPDIPKAYQISQYQFPFVKGGELAGVALTRIHLEEDTARSLHDQGSGSIVDFNRAGVPLMELVTEPVVHDAETAVRFGKELQLLLRSLGASDANMERGELRVEANISVSKTDELGTKVEVKNLNSFKAMEKAIIYEVKRQIGLIEKGERVIQETRGWDENRDKTFAQRTKETAEDYRYFPDPDIPKISLDQIPEFSKSRIAEILNKTPENKRKFYSEISVPSAQTELIIADAAADTFFMSVVAELNDSKEGIRLAANYLTSDVPAALEANGEHSISTASPTAFAQLMEMLVSGAVNSRVAKDILPEVLTTGADPKLIAEERGLLQVSDDSALIPVVDELIAANQSVVDEYRGGKEASLQFLIGQGMKATRGSADPAVLAKLIRERLQ